MADNPIVRGDRILRLVTELKDALEKGGVPTGFTFTSADYGEFDAYTSDGTKVEIRVEVGR